MLEDNRGFNDAGEPITTKSSQSFDSDQFQIDSVQDLLNDPATAHIAASADGKAVYAVVRLYGGMGSDRPQGEGQSFVRALIDHAPKPGGLARIYQTGPAPTIGDEIAGRQGAG